MPSILIQTFLYKQLAFNPTRHVWVPRHTLLPSQETNEMLLKHKIDRSQLPLILVTDPIAKYFGAIPHDVFRIEREDIITEATRTPTRATIYYRLVTKNPAKKITI